MPLWAAIATAAIVRLRSWCHEF